MIQVYSKRLLSPYTGQVQIVETDRARALTLDGDSWAVQLKVSGVSEIRHSQAASGREAQEKFLRVANISKSGIQRLRVPAYLDLEELERQVQLLAEYVADVTLPFPAADFHEYWLLDEYDESPLALIYSCIHAEEMPNYPHNPEWTTLSSAMMKVEQTEEELKVYTPPVNYRFEQLVRERAGKRPKARWIKRRDGLTEHFPSLLVREDWENEEDRLICQRYIERSAPRLLMLHGLDHEERLRLEGYARQNVLEVERFFHLYPEVADKELMSVMRVEARLRIAADETNH